MQVVHEPQEHYLVVQQKLKGQCSSVYLTILSVIQGVALADLALIVANNAQQFTFTQWMQVLLTFGALIMTWQQYTMHIISLEWIPDLRDAFIPFGIGACELFLNHLIPQRLVAWLLVLALLSALGALAAWHGERQASKEVENLPLLTGLRRRFHVLMGSNLGAMLFLLLLALESVLGHVQAAQPLTTIQGGLAFVIVLLVAASSSGLFLVTVWYWQAVVTYARTGHMPGKQPQQPGT